MNDSQFPAALILCALLMTGCGQAASTEKGVQPTDAHQNIQELRDRVAALETSQSLSEFASSIEETAFLKPGDNFYSIIKIDMGHLTVSLDDVTSYANGSKVQLRFGNITAANLTDLNALIEWGSVDQNGLPIKETVKSKEVRFTEKLRSGAWTRVKVALEGVPPDALGFVRLSKVGHDGIELLDRRN